MKVVIIGGVAGGASAAARLRRLDESAEIVMLERTGYVSYANCGLPYYVGGVIADRAELTLQTPERFRERFNIDVRVGSEVTAINREAKTVSVREAETGRIYEEPYDKLILAPGAAPVVPAAISLDSPRVFTLRTVEDALALRAFVTEKAPRRAVVVGGGFIGIEAAENLVEMGVETTLVQRPAQLLKPLDADMAAFVHAEMRAHGVRLVLGGSLEAVDEEACGLVVRLGDGEALPADLVVLAIGVAPEAHLAAEAGLALGQRGSIAADASMRTSDPDIFAVGDAVEVTHGVTGKKALVALAGPANKQGRIAADVICGLNSRYGGSWGSSVIKVFDLTVASTGLNEAAARAQGYDCDAVILSPGSHAGYYPGARPLTMKVVFERDTLRLLGAQIVGAKGADKRIDVLACAMQLGADGVRLKDLDLAYAPPYSSAKDPVNMAGFMIENVAAGLMKQAGYDEIPALRSAGATLLDVRTDAEWDRGHIDGFVHIPLDELRDRLGELPASAPVYVTCQSGLRSYVACRMLAQHGFDAYNFRGGYGFYRVVAADGEPVRCARPCGAER